MHPCFLWDPGVCVVPWRRGHWAQAPPVLREGAAGGPIYHQVQGHPAPECLPPQLKEGVFDLDNFTFNAPSH